MIDIETLNSHYIKTTYLIALKFTVHVRWSSGRALVQQTRGVGFESHWGRFPFLPVSVSKEYLIFLNINFLSILINFVI